MLHIQKKFWRHVEEALNNIEQTGAYYMGGTLSLPLGKNKSGKDIGICLNLFGRGFVLSDLKNTRVYLPDFITELVKNKYLRYNGKTEYFIKAINNG